MMFKRSVTCKTMVAAALLWIVAMAGAAPGVRSQVDRNTVSAGESFTLSIILEDMSATTTPAMPGIPNVNIAGPATRSEIQVINGQQTQRQVYDYQLFPTQPGDLTIP